MFMFKNLLIAASVVVTIVRSAPQQSTSFSSSTNGRPTSGQWSAQDTEALIRGIATGVQFAAVAGGAVLNAAQQANAQRLTPTSSAPTVASTMVPPQPIPAASPAPQPSPSPSPAPNPVPTPTTPTSSPTAGPTPAPTTTPVRQRPEDSISDSSKCKAGLMQLSGVCWEQELYKMHKNYETMKTIEPKGETCPVGYVLAPEGEHCISDKDSERIKENARKQFPTTGDLTEEERRLNPDAQPTYEVVLFKHLLPDGKETKATCEPRNAYATTNGLCVCKIGYNRIKGECKKN